MIFIHLIINTLHKYTIRMKVDLTKTYKSISYNHQSCISMFIYHHFSYAILYSYYAIYQRLTRIAFLHSSTFNAPLLVITMFIYYFCKKLLHNPIFEIVKQTIYNKRTQLSQMWKLKNLKKLEKLKPYALLLNIQPKRLLAITSNDRRE